MIISNKLFLIDFQNLQIINKCFFWNKVPKDPVTPPPDIEMTDEERYKFYLNRRWEASEDRYFFIETFFKQFFDQYSTYYLGHPIWWSFIAISIAVVWWATYFIIIGECAPYYYLDKEDVWEKCIILKDNRFKAIPTDFQWHNKGKIGIYFDLQAFEKLCNEKNIKVGTISFYFQLICILSVLFFFTKTITFWQKIKMFFYLLFIYIFLEIAITFAHYLTTLGSTYFDYVFVNPNSQIWVPRGNRTTINAVEVPFPYTKVYLDWLGSTLYAVNSRLIVILFLLCITFLLLGKLSRFFFISNIRERFQTFVEHKIKNYLNNNPIKAVSIRSNPIKPDPAKSDSK